MATQFSDSGTGADANPVGGSLTTVTGFDAIRRVSNQFANASGGSTNSACYINTVADQGDQWVQVRVAVVGGQDAGPALRIQTATGYQVFLQNASGGTDFNLYLYNAGYTLLDNDAGVYSTNDDIYAEVQGNAYVTKESGTTRNSVTNATFATGRMGINMYTGDTRFINFDAGDFTAGSTGLEVPRNLFLSGAVNRASNF